MTKKLALIAKPQKHEDGRVTVTSREVAEDFGKRHSDVLRSIEALECSGDFRERNFAFSEYIDAAGKKTLPQYHMTRDGFVFLAMGFTGQKAAQFKEAYIQLFNLHEQQHIDYREWANELKALSARIVDGQLANQKKIGVLEDKVFNDHEKRLRLVEERTKQRKGLSKSTKRRHDAFVDVAYHGMCCICGENKAEEYDHFVSVDKAWFNHTWKICKACHNELTTGRLARSAIRTAFDEYQRRAKSHRKQLSLF